jgi:UDP-N-acetylglucosamine 3-dehydrogenase
MKKFRVGVIGAGAIAQACHIPGFAAAKNCQLVAFADPSPEIREMVSQKWAFGRQYPDHASMLKSEQLDVVSIGSPNAFHKTIAIDCIKKGVSTILLEKPIAVTLADGKAIVQAARKHGTRIMVGFSNRFNTYAQAAKAALDKGLIGKPYMIRVRFAHMGPLPGWAKTDWFYNPKLSGGGAMLDMAIHGFDLAQYYLGPVTAVMARAATLRKKVKVDDNTVTLLEFGRSALGYVEAGWTSPAGFCGVEIMGDAGCIYVDYNSKVTLVMGSRDASGRVERNTTVLCEKMNNSWADEMAYFTSQLGKRGKFCVGIDDGLAALKVALAALKSSKTGRRVEIE